MNRAPVRLVLTVRVTPVTGVFASQSVLISNPSTQQARLFGVLQLLLAVDASCLGVGFAAARLDKIMTCPRQARTDQDRILGGVFTEY